MSELIKEVPIKGRKFTIVKMSAFDAIHFAHHGAYRKTRYQRFRVADGGGGASLYAVKP